MSERNRVAATKWRNMTIEDRQTYEEMLPEQHTGQEYSTWKEAKRILENMKANVYVYSSLRKDSSVSIIVQLGRKI